MSRWKEAPADAAPRPATRGKPAALAATNGLSDPYARWGVLTQWRGFARSLPPRSMKNAVDAGQPRDERGPAGTRSFEVSVICRARDPDVLAMLLAKPESVAASLRIPPMYGHAVAGADTKPSCFFTARLAREDLAELDRHADRLEWELALPIHAPESFAQATTVGRYGPRSTEGKAPLFDEPAQARPIRLRSGPVSAGSVGDAIAIVDFGCPFLNRRFAKASDGMRIAALWDQAEQPNLPPGGSWQLPSGAGYGRELGRSAIDALAAHTAGPDGLDEESIYRSVDYLVAYDDPRRRIWFATHGAHVMDMAAGTVDPLAVLRCTAAADPRHAELDKAEGDAVQTDAAGRADIVFVQLPSLAAGDSSGGSLSAHLLDGIRYAMDVCQKNATLVVNISYGSFAGSHDGKSLLERAMDDLLAGRPKNFAIVLAAGNARLAQCHARRSVRPHASALLQFAVTPGDTTDTFLELWYPRASDDGPKVGALNVRVRTSGRDWSPWQAADSQILLYDEATAEPLAMLQHRAVVSRGAKSMVLFALAPTAAGTDDVGPLNDPGLWEMEVALAEGSSRPVTFDAWIERDDPGDCNALAGAAQPSFVGLDKGDEFDTLSSIASGGKTVVVAGYRWREQVLAPYGSLPPFAAAGQADRLPLLLAPCEEDAWQPDLPAAAIRGNDVHRMNGTSVAAPVVARRLFDHLVAHRGTVLTPATLQQVADASDGIVRVAVQP